MRLNFIYSRRYNVIQYNVMLYTLYSTVLTEAEYKSDFKLTKDTI